MANAANAADGAGFRVDGGHASIGTSLIDNQGKSCSIPYGSSLTSAGGNAASDATCRLVGPSDVQGVPLLLGPLAANGGPTATHLPLPGSPARNVLTGGLCDPSLTTDQRGVDRPTGAACDRGSVEQ